MSKPSSTQPPPASQPDVEVRLSTRRRKYATAFWQSDRIVVVLPARLPRSQRDLTVDRLVQRVLRHRPHIAASDETLAIRSVELADTYLDSVRASSVRWSSQQRHRWGSCSLDSRQIRISELLRPAPGWVVDAVLVHELAHLIEHGHGPRFAALVARYERTVEADAFLAGYALGLDHDRDAGSDRSLDDEDQPVGESHRPVDDRHSAPGLHPLPDRRSEPDLLLGRDGHTETGRHPGHDGHTETGLLLGSDGHAEAGLLLGSDGHAEAGLLLGSDGHAETGRHPGHDGNRPGAGTAPSPDGSREEEPGGPARPTEAPVAVPVPLF